MKNKNQIKIVFVTGNELKFKIASDILSTYGVKVFQEKIKVPEIQSDKGKEVCEYSAIYASEKLKKTVIKTDVSYQIPSLGGFPGPFVKYINSWLKAEDIIRLLSNKKNRKIVITEYLSIASPDGKVTTFSSSSDVKIAERVSNRNKGTTFDQLIIRKGFSVPQNLMSKEDLQDMFIRDVAVWHDLGKYLKKSHNLS